MIRNTALAPAFKRGYSANRKDREAAACPLVYRRKGNDGSEYPFCSQGGSVVTENAFGKTEWRKGHPGADRMKV